MSMNKDEALKCLGISKKKFEAGETESAIRFAKKSMQLCETDEGKAWLEFLEKHSSSSTKSSTSTNPTSKPSSSSTTNNNASSSSSSSTPPEAPPSRPFTQEQVDGIKRIKAVKAKGDLYGILGLEKGCSDADIKKAYRKLALQFHPDKCGAPGTDDAFKAIGHAFAVLGDEKKKEQYDRFGVDSESAGAGRGGGGDGGGGHPAFRHGGFGEEISPEDLFNMFFSDLAGNGINIRTGFGGGPQFRTFRSTSGFQHPRFRQHQHQRQPNNHQANQANANQARLIQCLQMLPVLLLIFFSLLSSITGNGDDLSSSNTLYSWDRTATYSMGKVTPLHHVQYYVNPRSFARHVEVSERKLKQFENAVEDQYHYQLQLACMKERQYKSRLVAESRSILFGVDKRRLEEAERYQMKNCEGLVEWAKRVEMSQRKNNGGNVGAMGAAGAGVAGGGNGAAK
ncbi:hypothetical protein HDU76_002941 [Blyttiomyces sp. JEL0837]|nr:hypothetical protein HDU76_002941 [Blyttiomyces sp. JEL0837]